MKKARLMVVEDESIVAEDLRRCLTRLGHDVVGVASNAEGAVEMATETHPDLALLDIQLQGNRDGVDLADQFKSEFDIPVIFLTAFSNDSTLAKAKQVQPYGYLLKPFSEEELKSNIEMAVYRHWVESEKEEDFRRLQDALEKLKSVNGLLPICSACKKIRNSKGGWQSIESYFTEHSGSSFTHGICPECYKEAYDNRPHIHE